MEQETASSMESQLVVVAATVTVHTVFNTGKKKKLAPPLPLITDYFLPIYTCNYIKHFLYIIAFNYQNHPLRERGGGRYYTRFTVKEATAHWSNRATKKRSQNSNEDEKTTWQASLKN